MSHAEELRASSVATNTPLDPAAVTDRAVDPLLPGGTMILDFVDAAFGDPGQLPVARQTLCEQVGEDGVVATAGVYAVLEMMNRIALGTGIPLSRARLAATRDLRQLAGLIDPHAEG